MNFSHLATRSAAFVVAMAIFGQAVLPSLAFADSGQTTPPETTPPRYTPPQEMPTPNGLPTELAPDAVAITDPAQIKAKLDGMTVYGRYYDGEDWIEYHLADGRTAYWEKGCTYPGKWWEQNGQICYAYPNYRNGTPNCFILYVRPDGSVEFVAVADDGSTYLASFSTKVDQGNTAHLPVGGLSPCVGV